MPRIRRISQGRRTRNATSQLNFCSNQSAEQINEQNVIERNRLSQIRATRTTEQREYANEEDMDRIRCNRSVISTRVVVNSNVRARRQINVALNTHRAAFHYNRTIDYSADQSVAIVPISVLCPHCNALRYKNETPGMCCASGKVKLTPLTPPPDALNSLLSGSGRDSKHFLAHIQKYNNCFQMTSFGATNVIRDIFMTIFKIQGQLYHRAGSLLPVPGDDYKFLHFYFMVNAPQEID
uniref:Helitron helicase-like domain-containing protein n=1 Tax=Musca domestica TaxID=7370 RepID=A0A1I8NL57_MUSDO